MKNAREYPRLFDAHRAWEAVGIVVIMAAALVLPVMAQAQSAAWPSAGQNIHNTRSAPDEHLISPSDVSHLAPRWVLTTDGNVTATPAVIKGVVYVPDYGGSLWAVDGATGKVIWQKKISSYTDIPGDVSRTTPAYWNGKLIVGDGVQTTKSEDGAFVLGIEARNGHLLWRTKVEANPGAIITSSPVVDRDIVYIGTSSKDEGLKTAPTFRGSVLALSATTGKILWKTYMVPDGYTGGAVWGSTPVIDYRTGLLYVATGNNYTVPAGICQVPVGPNCTPVPEADHIDSVVALNLKTGKIVWSTPTLMGDLSTNFNHHEGPDYDFAQGPMLYTASLDGKPTALLGVGQKSGIYWALNPETGRVVWKTKVGPGSRKGGMMWGSATDGQRVYVSIGNGNHVPVTLTSASGEYSTTTGGFWAALNAATGKILWETADPQHVIDTSMMSVANGVVYAGSIAGTGNNMYALDAATGTIDWGFASGGAVASGAAIVNGTVYWGSGYYTQLAMGLPFVGKNDKLYAFALAGN